MNDIYLTESDLYGVSSASSVGEAIKRKEEREAREDERQRKLLAPVVQALNTQIEELRKENELIKEENNKRAKEAEESKKEARKAKILSWISFGVSTFIAVASLIVAIVK